MDFSLIIETTGSHVPHKGLVQGHAKARPFLWEGGGSLVFEWQEPLALDKLRIFIGEIGNNYLVRTYLGGRLDETGVIRDPEGVQTALVTDDRRKIGQWAEVHFPAGTMADNIEVLALGTIVFYEIEIHARDDRPTAIQRLQWRQIKCGPKGLERPACSKSSSPQSLP